MKQDRPCPRPVLRYTGGKFRIAPQIVELMPAHDVYVEPYGGAASVLLAKAAAPCEVYNDIWGEVVNVFRQLRDSQEALLRGLFLTPYAREEYEGAYVTTTVGDFPIKGKGREGRSDAQTHLMATVPVGLLPGIEDFDLWMKAFAVTHPKPKTKEDPRVAGRMLGWTDGKSWYASRAQAEKGMEGRVDA